MLGSFCIGDLNNMKKLFSRINPTIFMCLLYVTSWFVAVIDYVASPPTEVAPVYWYDAILIPIVVSVLPMAIGYLAAKTKNV